MRNRTVGAVFDALFGPAEIAPAVFTERVQGTVTKKAAEPFRIDALVARKEFTFPVAEILIVFHILNYISIIGGTSCFSERADFMLK